MPFPDSATFENVEFRATDPDRMGDGKPRLPIAPNFPFFLAHWWENWEPVSLGLAEPAWLPQLQGLPVRPGVDGVHSRRTADDPLSVMYADVHDQYRRKGWVILPHNIQVQVGDELVVGYAVEADCEDPITKRRGTYHLERWQRPRRRREGQRLKFDFDRVAYNRWRAELVRQGHVAPPDLTLLDERKARILHHLERHQGKVALPEDVRDRLAAEAQVKLDRASNAVVPVAVEEPAPKRRRAPVEPRP